MEKLKALTKTLKELKTVASSVVALMFPIMETLGNEGDDIAGEVADETSIDKDVALEELLNLALEIVTDAKAVRKEIDAFADAVLKGSKALRTNASKFPFMAQVWAGDIYDVNEVDALKQLLKDLEEDKTKANESWLIDAVIARHKKEGKEEKELA